MLCPALQELALLAAPSLMAGGGDLFFSPFPNIPRQTSFLCLPLFLPYFSFPFTFSFLFPIALLPTQPPLSDFQR